MDLANLRRDYSMKELSESNVDADPFEQFRVWMNEALQASLPEPTAMTLSTVGENSMPSSRVVLLKGFSAEGFTFFTNYDSRKGRELTANPQAALNLFWPELERQVNVAGSVVKASDDVSDEYFASRPFESRIGAIASSQSQVLASRDELEERVAELTELYSGGDVPRPENWGGFNLSPVRFEFWQGRKSRLHDRIVYNLADGSWAISRLSP